MGGGGSVTSMDVVRLGNTGLRVSRVCLGMMSFGPHESREWALDESAAEPLVRRAVESGIFFFDTADVYNGGQSEVITGRLLPKLFATREEYVVATKVHGRTMPGPERRRALPQAHPRVDRRVARAPRPRLRRPVPDPPLGSGHADRGDDGRAARRRAGGQGALHRRVEHVRLAVREGAARRADALRLDAEPLQPRLPRGGARDDPAMRRPGRSRSCPGARWRGACSRATGRAKATCARRGRGRTSGARTCTGRRSTSRSSTGPQRWRPSGACRAAQVALAWLLHRRGVTAPIVGATRVEHLDDAIAAERLAPERGGDDEARGALRPPRRLRPLSERGRAARSRAGPRR